MTRADPRIPLDSLIFGFGPMLPLVAGAVGAWALPQPWPALAIRLSVVWAAMILVFIGGVRRGYGFGSDTASTAAEIAAMLAYFVLGGLALVSPDARIALVIVAVGLPLAALLDRRAARSGDAPPYFATLRPPQMAIGALSLVAMLVRIA